MITILKILSFCWTFGCLLLNSSALRMVDHPEDIFVNRNDPATLNCRAEGDPSPLITWYRNGEKIEKSSAYKILRSNGQLYFPSVNYLHHFFASSNNKLSKAAPDTGVYYCNATDLKTGLSVTSRNATLQLKDVMMEEYRDSTILSTETPLGEPVALQCKLQHTDHHSEVNQAKNGVTWMKDGAVVEGRDRVRIEWNGTLFIQEATKEDAGFYTCLIFSSNGPKESKPVRLMVLERPQIKEGPVGIKVELGGDAIFHCRATGDPEPIMSWRRKGGNLPQNRSKVLGSQSLLLSNVQVEDEGEYVCVVENTVGRDEKSAKMAVHVLPSFVLTPKSKSVNVGRRVSLECQAEGSPTPEVFWTKEDDKLHMLSDRKYGRMTVAKFGSLIIEKVQREDAGVYLCHAESVAGKTVIKTRLEVKDSSFMNTRLPPIILLGFQDQILPLKTTAVLLCNVTGDPPPIVSWFKNGKLLLLPEPKFKMLDDGTLTIAALDSGDAGLYTCKASSETGEATWNARLQVEPHTDTSIIFKRTPEPHTYPGSPIKLHPSEIKESSVRLAWKPNPDSGYSQVTSFAVEFFSHEAGEGWTRASENVKETYFVVRNLLPGTTYMFLVRAQNSHGTSYPSQVAVVKTKGSSNSDLNFQQTEESQTFFSSTPHRFHLSSHHAVHMVMVKLHQPLSSDVGSTHVKIRWDLRSSINSQQLSRHVEGFHIRYCVLPDLKSERKQGPGLDTSQFATQTVNDPHARSFYVHGLEENTRYMFYIQSYHNSTSKPASNKIFVKTKEDVPSAPPTNIQATVLENNTLRLTWMPPPKSHQNGPLVGYKVYVSANDSHTQKDVWLNSTAEVAFIHNLNTANTYQIQISAYSNAGEGQVSEPIFLGFRDNSAKMKLSHESSRETSWWVVLVCVVAAVLTSFIFISLLLMLRKQRKKDKEKETHYFTSGELGASIAQSTTVDKETKKPITPVFESTYENLSSVYSAQSTHGSTIDSKPSPAVNGTGKFGKSANPSVLPQAIHRFTQQYSGPPLLGNNTEQLICQTYMIKPKLIQDHSLKSDGYKGVYEGINNHSQLSESYLPSYEDDNTMSQLLAMRKMSLNCQRDNQMSNYFKPIDSIRCPDSQNNRFYTISNRASRLSRRPTSSDMEDSEAVFKAEVERRFLSGGRDLFSDLCSS